jgi:hypothetical protein
MHRETSRREMMVLAAGFAGWGRVYAASSEFWNKKDPSEWSSEEIGQLTTKSPWAKEATASSNEGGQGGGMGRHGGMGGGGMGGGGMGGGMGRHGGGMGGGGQAYRGTVRWESAKPVVDALKTKQFPDAFKDHYVISVVGFPIGGGRRRQQQTNDDNSSQSSADALDRLKGVTALQPKTKRDVQAGVVQQPEIGGFDTVWFGFSKDMLALRPEDKEVTFVTQFGRLNIKAKFVFKDMLYRGELAL